jgi:FtsH-binding integral membrane protein
MDSNTMKKLGVIVILIVFIIYGLSVVAAVMFLEAPTGLTVAYAVIALLFIVLLAYEGWQRIKEIDGGLEDAIDDY